MNFKQNKKLLVIAFLAIFSGTALYYNSTKKEEFIFLTEKSKIGNIEQVVTATGTIRSNNRVEVGAQVSGKITEITVKLGQKVKKGDILAKIDSSTQENDLNKLKSMLSDYKTQYESKKIEFNIKEQQYIRGKELYKLSSISLDDLDTLKLNYYNAKAQLNEIKEKINQSNIEIKTAEKDLSYTTITSPIDGVVISIPVSEGQTVNSMQTAPTIVQVADLNTMLIKAEISEGDITKLKEGQEVEFTVLSDLDKIYKGVISSIDPADTTLTDNEYNESISKTDAVYYYANIIVNNSDSDLRIGMTATNTIKINKIENTLTVPNLAVHKKGGKTFVSILEDKNKIVEKEVKIGLSDNFNTQIIEGLTAGEDILLNKVTNQKIKETSSSRPPRF